MFEPAELGQSVSKEEYKEREPALREQLLLAQSELRQSPFPVVILFAGVDAAGKGETANLLHAWMDPRGLVTHAFDEPTQEEAERPEFWRYWRHLPRRGRTGIFLSAWYHDPLLDRVNEKINEEGFDDRLDEIASFERTLAEDGALILKFWMHLSKSAQRKRLKALEKDPLQAWRVTRKDWDHWKKYERFIEAAEHLIMRTSAGHAPWTIVEGVDGRYRSLTVVEFLLDALRRRLAEQAALAKLRSAKRDSDAAEESAAPPNGAPGTTVLSRLDMDRKLSKKTYQKKLQELQGRLNLLHRRARERHRSLILVFEGWDAAGKGGAIRRITPALDARDYEVISIAAPSLPVALLAPSAAGRACDHLRSQLVRSCPRRACGGLRQRPGMAPGLRRDQRVRAPADRPRHRAGQVLAAHHEGRAEGPVPVACRDAAQAVEARG
jgi:polyphosphate kinase 2 (PPK2 family)